jgi:Secretion system C-terminal sorting domain
MLEDADGNTKQLAIAYADVKKCEGQTGIVSNIYPNPVSSKLHINISNSAKLKAAELVVTDITGRTMYAKNTGLSDGVNIVTIPVQQLAEGTYFVKIILPSGKTDVQKFIKLRQ